MCSWVLGAPQHPLLERKIGRGGLHLRLNSPQFVSNCKEAVQASFVVSHCAPQCEFSAAAFSQGDCNVAILIQN